VTLLAVDIGGTKVAVAVLAPDRAILAYDRMATEVADPDRAVARIVDFARAYRPDAVGVSVPAVLDHDDRLRWLPNLPAWDEYPLRDALRRQLGCPVVVEYDGHAAALGEWRAGAAQGFRSAAVIVIGTGIGGGFVIDGALWPGRDRLAGAVGYFPMPGRYGPQAETWEGIASGPAIARRWNELAGEAQARAPDAPTARAVFDAARRGDAAARQAISEAAEATGRGVAIILSALNPEVVVLTGGVGRQADMLLDDVTRGAERWAQPFAFDGVSIRCSSLEHASLIGLDHAVRRRIPDLTVT
jgi:glucokinase